MKWTKSPRIAMERLATVLGWVVVSSGRAWAITNLPCAEGLHYSAMAALCFMTRVARASEDIGGLGLTREEVIERIRFRPKHIFSRKDYRWYLDLHGTAATDESTMYANYFQPEELTS